MRRFLILSILAVAMMASADEIGLVFNKDISVTQANTATVFTDNGSGGSNVTFYAKAVLIRSLAASANTCYFDLKDKVATTSDTALEPGGSVVFEFPATSTGFPGGAQPVDGWPGMGSICTTAETATFRVTAVR
jgi:hypothetical protein